MNRENSLLIATRNSHKREEFEHLLAPLIKPVWDVYDVASWPEKLPKVEEDKDTFRENAIKKAYETSQAARSVTIADDSGLEVDALDGAPGVKSARYAGPNASDEENNAKLIEQLEQATKKSSTARYVCVVALTIPDIKLGRELLYQVGVQFQTVGPAEPKSEGRLARVEDRIVIWFRGEFEGEIVEEPKGEHGFGYDPHFYIPGLGKTMAEIPMDKKNELSHRAKALEKVVRFFSL